MQAKLMIRTVFISLALAGLILAGIYAFTKLRTGEQVYHTNIFDLVSEKQELFFYFPHPEVLTGDFPAAILPDTTSLPLVQSLLFPDIKQLPGAHNLLLCWQDQDGLILYRTTPDQIEAWEKLQLESGFFPYPALKREYAGIPYSIYLTGDDRFFCYAYHQGVFAGSYSQSLLQDGLAMFSQAGSTSADPSFTQVKSTAANASYAGCFFKEDSLWYAFDLTRQKDRTWINGSLQPNNDPKLYNSFPSKKGNHTLRTEFIPSTASALVFFDSDTSLFRQEGEHNRILHTYCTGNVAVIYYTSIDSLEQEFRTTCLELTDRRRFLYDIKKLLPDTLLAITRHAWHTDEEYVVYSTHKLPEHLNLLSCLGCFSREKDRYFTFYKENLLVSDSEEALLQYWKQIHTGKQMKDKEAWLHTYLNNKSEEAGAFIVVGKEALGRQSLAKQELIPQVFSKTSLSELFIQVVPEENIRLYNGILNGVKNEE